MEKIAVNKEKIKQLFLGVDYKNFTDFHSFRAILKRSFTDFSNNKVDDITTYLMDDLAIYCDGDLKDITMEELDELVNYINR